jgi:hypothetical protein
MMGVAQRRVHLGAGSEALVDVRRGKGEMLRRHLDRGDVVVVAEESQFVGGRDMQHVDAAAGFAGEPQQALGGEPRGLRIAPHRVAGGIARDPQACARVQPVLVFGVERCAAADIAQYLPDRGIVLDQQIAGRRSHEGLDPAAAGQALQFAEVGDIGPARPDIEGEVAGHPAFCMRDLVRDRLRRHRGGPGIGHLEHRRDAAGKSRPAAGFEILLVLRTRFAEVHVSVDHAGQHVEPGAVDGVGRARRLEAADPGDAPVPDRNIALPDAVVVDDGSVPEQKIVGGWQKPGAP